MTQIITIRSSGLVDIDTGNYSVSITYPLGYGVASVDNKLPSLINSLSNTSISMVHSEKSDYSQFEHITEGNDVFAQAFGTTLSEADFQFLIQEVETEESERARIKAERENGYDEDFFIDFGVPRGLEDANGELGLRSVWANNTKQKARNLLGETDWYLVRNYETGEAVPVDVTTYRAAIRAREDVLTNLIVAATTLEEFMPLVETPLDANGDPTGVAPVHDWPTG